MDDSNVLTTNNICIISYQCGWIETDQSSRAGAWVCVYGGGGGWGGPNGPNGPEGDSVC